VTPASGAQFHIKSLVELALRRVSVDPDVLGALAAERAVEILGPPGALPV